MLAYADDEALRRTRETGEAWFWSRSRERALAQGRDLGEHDGGRGDRGRLRRRRAALPRPAERAGVPHGRGVVLRAVALAHRRRAGGDAPRRAPTSPSLLEGGPAAAARKVGEEGVEAALAGVAETRRAARRGARRPLVPHATSSSPRAGCSRRRSRTSSVGVTRRGRATDRRVQDDRRHRREPGDRPRRRRSPRAAHRAGRSASATARTIAPPRKRSSTRDRGRPAGAPSPSAGDVSVEADVLALSTRRRGGARAARRRRRQRRDRGSPARLRRVRRRRRCAGSVDVNVIGALLCAREAARRLARVARWARRVDRPRLVGRRAARLARTSTSTTPPRRGRSSARARSREGARGTTACASTSCARASSRPTSMRAAATPTARRGSRRHPAAPARDGRRGRAAILWLLGDAVLVHDGLGARGHGRPLATTAHAGG